MGCFATIVRVKPPIIATANIIICSTDAPHVELAEAIRACNSNRHPTVVLTPHVLFAHERAQLAPHSNKLCYATFSDFVHDSDLESIDIRAFEIESALGTHSVDTYYRLVQCLKNQTIADNLIIQYNAADKFVIGDGQGVVSSIWQSRGFATPQVNPSSESPTVRLDAASTEHLSSDICASALPDKLALIRSDDDVILFCGSLERLSQRLAADSHVRPFSLPSQRSTAANLLGQLLGHRESEFNKRVQAHIYEANVTVVATSVHEYDDSFSVFANRVGLPFVIFQDSYIPHNYTSRYAKYFRGVDVFYVSDTIARAYFERIGLRSCVSRILQPQPLRKVVRREPGVSKVVFVASTVGDWSALKSRSDPDLFAQAAVDTALAFPNIRFVYRAHPFAVHDSHEGRQAFSRVAQLFLASGARNISLSGESIAMSNRFLDTGHLSVAPQSFNNDIADADLVIGEHSIGLIDAARLGIVISSLNPTRRRNLFDGYTQLGFLHCSSLRDACDLIAALDQGDGPVRQHNSAVHQFNQQIALRN